MSDETVLENPEELLNAPDLPRLGRVDRAAVFLLLLSDEEAASLLSRMDPDELEQLGRAMVALGEVDREAMAEALEDFVSESAREIMASQNRNLQVRSLLERSLGPTKAESMMLRIDPVQRPRSIEMARWLAPSVLIKLVEDEHPQVIAAILLMLEPEPAAEVLSELSADIQSAVVEKIASMGAVSSQAVELIDALLSQRIGAKFGATALTIGGPREAANLINLSAGDLRSTVLPVIAQRNAPLAERIEEEMFTFEMLLDLEQMAMGRLLRDVDTAVLVDALKGASEEERDPFLRAMSSRAADGIKDEIEMRGRLSRKEVEMAQRKVIDTARSLADQGEIDLGGGGGEFV